MAAAMAAGIFPIIGIGVLATFILSDLGISRAQLGLSITVASGVSAVSAIAMGRFLDRRGGRTALITVFGLSAVAMIGVATAPTYGVVLGASVVAGLAMGSSNPATNGLIVETIARSRWGTVTGIKQAGEALPIVLGGLVLPGIAIASGWRTALGVTALLPAAAILFTLLWIPAGRRRGESVARRSGAAVQLDPNILWLSAYSFIVGLAATAIATYLPLYAEESLDMTPASAGMVFAAMGMVAIVGRVVWGHAARDVSDVRSRLRWIAVLAIAAAVVLWSGSHVAPELIWIGAILWGTSILSVGALGNLAVMHYSIAGDTGRASGVMLTGFGIGLMIGAPLFGLSVDVTGSYDLGFGLLLAELVALLVVSIAWDRRPSTRPMAGVRP
jgi:predicted MFS family arabinose efflux permease